MFTTLLIVLVVIAGAVTAAGGGLLYLQRRKQLGGSATPLLTSGGEAALLERTIRDLRTGDILIFDGKDYLVEGVIGYDEDGHRWSAGRILDSDDERWVVVGLERGGTFRVRLMQVDPELEIEGFPPETLLVGEQRFTQGKRGTATGRMTGEAGVGKPPAVPGAERVERCRWWLYETPGDDTLLVEQWSDAYRVLRGKIIDASRLELMPGS